MCPLSSCRPDNIDNDHSYRGLQLRNVAAIGDDSHSIYCYRNSDKYVYNDIPTIETILVKRILLLYNDNCYKYEKYIQIINMQRRSPIFLNDHDKNLQYVIFIIHNTDKLIMNKYSRRKKEEYV